VQPQHSAHTVSPVLHAVEDSTYLANSLLRGGTYPSPLHSAPPTCHLHALRARPHIQHVTRTSAQPRPRPPTSTSPPFLACPVRRISQQTGRSPKPVADGAQTHHTHTQAGGRTPQRSTAHDPHTHARELPTHSLTHAPTHALCVRRPQTHAHTYDSLSGLLRCLG
jgi:hypothetical protein